MRTSVLLLVLTLLPLSGSAKERPITIYDATGGTAAVLIEIQDFLDAGVPLHLTGNHLTSCAAARRHAPANAIVICFRELPNNWGGLTKICGNNCQEVIRLDPNNFATGTVCHELMHALTHIGDKSPYPELDRSCVWGLLDHLGPFDRRYLRHHLTF